ncbi:hypothetical protein ACLB2K_035302 [Fragaria x ananassa]
MAAKILANLIVMGSGILARAVVQAYRQALANASKSGVAQETLQNAARRAGKVMTEQEARQILGISEETTWEEVLKANQTNDRVDPRSLNFQKNGYGKPEVDCQIEDDWQPPALHFNISRTSSLIACGVAADSPIGIDVEEKQRKLKHHILAFARRYFSSHEVEHLTSIEIQRHQFIKLWTLKLFLLTMDLI